MRTYSVKGTSTYIVIYFPGSPICVASLRLSKDANSEGQEGVVPKVMGHSHIREISGVSLRFTLIFMIAYHMYGSVVRQTSIRGRRLCPSLRHECTSFLRVIYLFTSEVQSRVNIVTVPSESSYLLISSFQGLIRSGRELVASSTHRKELTR